MDSGKTVITGAVLRTTDTKEADKILTVLSPQLGKIPVIARGARRKNSRLAAACQLLAYDELTVYKRGGWYMLDEASTLELFPGVRRDIVRLSLASWFAELTEAVCPEEAPAPELASLLLNGLYALCYLDKDPALVKTAFQWRLMALAGFQPFVDGCAVCGAEEPAAPMLDVVHGVVRCGGCKSGGGLSLPLTAAGLAALRHILTADGKKLYSFTLESGALRALDHAGEAFIAAQLERNFKTLDYYKSLIY